MDKFVLQTKICQAQDNTECAKLILEQVMDYIEIGSFDHCEALNDIKQNGFGTQTDSGKILTRIAYEHNKLWLLMNIVHDYLTHTIAELEFEQ
jgi:hypothetical protein